MNLSKFSQKFLGDCGILRLMDDLGRFVGQEGVMMLGGGNPSHIPEVQQIFRERMGRILDSESDFEKLVGNYDGPAGNADFISALVDFFNEEYGWQIGPQHIALTNGSQTAFFMLFNMLAGTYPDGSHKKILLPLAPEYIGYADVGLVDDLFTAQKPQINFLGDHLFKYSVDFDALDITDEIGAICVSRPTNPTGNVLTEEEIAKLSALAKEHQIPFIVDNAYGTPFPGIIFTDATAKWEPHVIMCMSLSKLGLPGARTGIIIAHETIVQAMTGMNAVISLAPGSLGASMALDLVRTREIIRISHEMIRPHYQEKVEKAVAWVREELAGTSFYIHKPEGSIFLWLWFKDLPITSQTLYERLSARGVIIVPGQYFFPGISEEWQHKDECIRMSYAADEEQLRAGIKIIAEEVKRAWHEAA